MDTSIRLTPTARAAFIDARIATHAREQQPLQARITIILVAPNLHLGQTHPGLDR
ncbi:MAG: hypothetical protein N0E59_02220 [Candidatus Thiodiazotropha taylori]|nr:hypothetical protein [Candidatus Thiodiazotropha taylori]MCG8109558.1 hypothetical protein [Candidatus Thiodiazotropha taylori]MCW4281899.1 hypothetical protein [Candidatus Thiodiazotropha taylori]